MLNSKTTNYIHLHFIVFIWGFTAVLGALISISATPLVWYRVSLASVFILLYILFRKETLAIGTKTLLRYVFGGILIGLHWITFFHAIKISNVSVALATMSTGALFTTLLERLFFKKKFIPHEIIFALLAILGLTLIFYAHGNYFEGLVVGLISAFLSACFTLLNSKLIKHNSASVISFYELLTASVLIGLILFFTGKIEVGFFQLSGMDWLYLIILASVCTAYAFVASTYVLKKASAFTMMLTINLEPIYGVILALLVFGEKEVMSPNFYLGAAIILITVVLNGIVKLRRKKAVSV